MEDSLDRHNSVMTVHFPDRKRAGNWRLDPAIVYEKGEAVNEAGAGSAIPNMAQI